jgi:hypothetical protein
MAQMWSGLSLSLRLDLAALCAPQPSERAVDIPPRFLTSLAWLRDASRKALNQSFICDYKAAPSSTECAFSPTSFYSAPISPAAHTPPRSAATGAWPRGSTFARLEHAPPSRGSASLGRLGAWTAWVSCKASDQLNACQELSFHGHKPKPKLPLIRCRVDGLVPCHLMSLWHGEKFTRRGACLQQARRWPTQRPDEAAR